MNFFREFTSLTSNTNFSSYNFDTGYVIYDNPNFEDSDFGADLGPDVSIAKDIEPAFGDFQSIEFNAASAPLTMGAMVLSNTASSYQTSLDQNKDLSGRGVAGNDWESAFQARADVTHDELVSNENMGIIAASSLLGPEGLAVGLVAAGANSLLNTTENVSVTANTGQQVTV